MMNESCTDDTKAKFVPEKMHILTKLFLNSRTVVNRAIGSITFFFFKAKHIAERGASATGDRVEGKVSQVNALNDQS